MRDLHQSPKDLTVEKKLGGERSVCEGISYLRNYDAEVGDAVFSLGVSLSTSLAVGFSVALEEVSSEADLAEVPDEP